jgi:hypothetical protein
LQCVRGRFPKLRAAPSLAQKYRARARYGFAAEEACAE